MTKSELRKQIKSHIFEKGFVEEKNSQGFLASFKKLLCSSSPKTVFAFLSHTFEPNTSEIISYLINQSIHVALPRMDGHTLSFFYIESIHDTFEIGKFGIREPFECEKTRVKKVDFPLVILIPGMAYSYQGDRLGHGKGYYDRFLSEFLFTHKENRGEIILVGMCHEKSLFKKIPIDDHDVKVDCLITEKNYTLCSKEF